MKWSKEIAEDRSGNVVIFNYAYGKLPDRPPAKHRVLYTEHSLNLNDDELKKEVCHHFVISSMLLG